MIDRFGTEAEWCIIYEDVPAGDYQFKITDGTWDKCWGDDSNVDGNDVFSLEYRCDITISFDPYRKTISVSTSEDQFTRRIYFSNGIKQWNVICNREDL